MFKFMNMHKLMETADDGKGAGGGDSTAQLAALAEKVELLTTSLNDVTADRDLFKAKHTEAEGHRKKAEKKAADDAAAALLKTGTADDIKASYDEKIAGIVGEHDAAISGLNKVIQDVTAGAASKAMATELSVDGNPAGLEPHIRPRLSSEMKDGKPVTVVLDKNGKPSIMTVAELKAEIGAIEFLAPMIKGSNASGAGNPGNGKTSVKGKTMLRSEFDLLPQAQKSGMITGKDAVTIVDD